MSNYIDPYPDAFPRLETTRSGDDLEISSDGGMSLMDYFAIRLMPICLTKYGGKDRGIGMAAEQAYEIAEVLLMEREKRLKRK